MKKKSSSDSAGNSTPSRGKFRTFLKRIVIIFAVPALSLAVILFLCRKPLAARIIEQQLLASGFSKAEVVIDTLSNESIGGSIKGDTAIADEFATGQATFLIRCPWKEIVNRSFGQIEITLSDAAVLIDPTTPIQEPSTAQDSSPPTTTELQTTEPTLRETLAGIHKRIARFHLATPIRIGRKSPDQATLIYSASLNEDVYKHGDKLQINLALAHDPKIQSLSDLNSNKQTFTDHFHFTSDLDFAPQGKLKSTLSATLSTRRQIPFLPEPWRSYQPSVTSCDIFTELQWAPDDSLDLRSLDIQASQLTVDHPQQGSLTATEAHYAYNEDYQQLDLTETHGEIHLPAGARITLPETSPLTAQATANYRDDRLDQLTVSLTSDAMTYNHGRPMGSVDLGDIKFTHLHASVDYKDHPSPWHRRALISLRTSTYGAVINSAGAFLTDLNNTNPLRTIGTIAFSEFPLDPVDIPDALAPTLVDYELTGRVNGQFAVGLNIGNPEPLTSLSLTANGTSLGIKHRNDPINISGGELTIHFPDLREPTTLHDQRFSITKADAGSIHAKNITGKMSLDNNANLQLNDVEGTSFGGTVRLKKATIPADDSPYTLDLHFNHVDAADLVALYPDFKGTITGKLSGRVPIIFGSKTLPRAGRLQLDENSVSTLRYDASDIFSTDSQRDQIIRTALADLNVTTLDVYIFDPARPKGEINIVIGGTSNKLFNGAPVPIEAFNINMDLSEAEEFIFDLLTSVNGLSFE